MACVFGLRFGEGGRWPTEATRGAALLVGAEGGVRVSEQIVRRYALGKKIVLRECVRGQVRCVSPGIARYLGVGL